MMLILFAMLVSTLVMLGYTGSATLDSYATVVSNLGFVCMLLNIANVGAPLASLVASIILPILFNRIF